VILPDVNVLVHAYRESAEEHTRYATWLNEILQSDELLLPDAVVVGFVRVVTSAALARPSVSAVEAYTFVDALRRAAWVRTSLGSRIVLDRLRDLCENDPGIRGNLVTDAYLAATAIAHDARLATRDRGFARFPGLRWFDPARAG
jgi:uncharacterized protein